MIKKEIRQKIILAFLLICGTVTLFFIDRWQLKVWRCGKANELQTELNLFHEELSDTIETRLVAVEALASLFIVNPQTNADEFAKFSQFLLKYNYPVRALQYADSETRVTFVYPPKNNMITINEPMTLISDPKRGPFVKRAITEKRAIAQGPFELRQGGTGLIFRFPIFENDEFLGLAIGVYDVDILINEALEPLNTDPFVFGLEDGQGNLFWKNGKIADEAFRKKMPVGGSEWTLTANWASNSPAPCLTRILTWVMGIPLLLLLSISLLIGWNKEKKLQITVDKRTKELSNLNNDLIEKINEKIKTEEILRNERQRLDGIIEGTNVGTWEWNIESGEVVLSKRWAEIIGYSLEEITPSTKEVWESYTTPESMAFRNELLKRHFDGEIEYYECEIEMNHKNGETVWVMDRGKVITRTKTGSPLMMMGTLMDITIRKKAEIEKKVLESQLIQSQKMESVGRLAGGVAHDFNNMLGVILGFTELAVNKVKEDDPIHTFLSEIMKATLRSRDIVKQLLAFARKQVISPRVININKTITNMFKMLERLIGEDIELEWIPGDDSQLINMDPSQIDQILANLCINSRDAIPETGKIVIQTETVTFDEEYCTTHHGFIPGDFVRIAVSDNGEGMDRETKAQIFDPFFTTKETGKGTGLGLSTVYGIVKQNDGFLNVYSEPGHGTSFHIYFPLFKDQKEESIGKKEKPDIIKGDETVLLVEDEPSIMKMTTIMLEELGYNVIPAETTAKAIHTAEQKGDEIKLLITDVIMPEMNGHALAEMLLMSHPNLKCLFMSGYTADIIAHHGVLEKGIDFIQKPFSIRDLGVAVRRAIDN